MANYDGGTSRTPPNTGTDTNVTQDAEVLNKQTLRLVEELKRKTQSKDPSENSEQSIENAVTVIRSEQNHPQIDIKKWKRVLPDEIKHCPDSILYETLAYGNDADTLDAVLRIKMKEYDSNSKNRSKENRAETSLNEIIGPLKKINDKLSHRPSKNLFRAVLEVNDNDIDRADRMFYSEARSLLGFSQDYTFELAHDQVQAIRLMHYESDDDNELRRFIETSRNFDEAYSYLQKLTKSRTTQGARSSTIVPTPRSIIRSSDDGNNRDNSSSSVSNSDPYYNSSNNSSSNRPPSGTDRSRNQQQ